MFVHISSEQLNLLLQLFMLMHYHELECLVKRWFAVLKVKVTVKVHIIKIWLSTIPSEVLIHLQPNLVWWYIIISWVVLWKDWIAVLYSRSKSQQRFKISISVHLDDIFPTAEPFVTRFVVVTHHLGPECYKKRLFCYLQDQGDS